MDKVVSSILGLLIVSVMFVAGNSNIPAMQEQTPSVAVETKTSKTLFVGDSRTVDMFDADAFEILGKDHDGITVYGRNGGGIRYFNEVMDTVNLDDYDTVVTWLGCNNWGDFTGYGEAYEKILGQGKTLIVCTVGPTDDNALEEDDIPYYYNEKEIAFNASLTSWANAHSVKVIDLYTYCQGNITISPDDGIHYLPQPTTKLWEYILSTL